MKNIYKNSLSMSGVCLILLTVLFAFSQAHAQGSLIVNTLTDHDDGICNAADCTLREAVKYAPAGATITFSVTGTITLTNGDITIAKNLTITGPTAAPGITVSGNNVSRIFTISGATVALSGLTLSGGNGTGGDSYWDGNGGAIDNSGVLTLTNSTITGSNAQLFGGGVYNRNSGSVGSTTYNKGTLTLTGSVISGNSGSRGGGGIFNGGDVTATGSTFSNNTAGGAQSGGGAIFNKGSVNVSSSTFSGNSTPTDGGAISNYNVVTVANSTFNGNTCGNDGGALFNYSYGTMTVTNSTLFGNKAPSYFGGGIYNYGTLTVASSTISGNSAAARTGGGIENFGGTLNLSNSIVAGNTSSTTFNGPDINGSVTSGDYNLVQNTAGTSLPGTHNITGQPAQLAALANNGGATQTMALLSNSQAVNAGDPNFDAGATPYDQRGAGFPRVQNGRVDIGAFESAFVNRVPLATDVSFSASPNSAFSGQLTVRVGAAGDTLTYSIVTGTLPAGLTLDPTTGIISGTTTVPSHSTFTFKATDNHGADSNAATATFDVLEPPSLVVTTISDTTGNDGVTSLREAVAYANSGNAGANPVITFSVTGIIEMKSPAISIAKNLTITGPGAGSLTLSGNGNDGVNYYAASIFNISSGIVGISGLTLRDGTGTANPSNNQDYGGAIYMTGGTVTVSGSTISNNYANNGGAIYINGGSLTVTGSTISNNNIHEYNFGGGIYVDGGSVAVNNTSIFGNIAGIGAGIFGAGGTVNIANSTISGNTAETYGNLTSSIYGFGGGIFNNGAGVTIANSTITNNTARTNNIARGGGGIDNNGGTVNLSNSIIAGNTASDGPDIKGNTSGDYNLVQNGPTPTGGTHNIMGQPALLGALANNGGPTLTHMLLQGSLAIDAGDPNFDASATPYDQRGVGFPRVMNGRVDIGAFESDKFQNGSSSLIVNTLTDHDDGNCGTTDCTLREAVKYAPAGAAITFSVTGTITLTGGEIVIANNLTITGPASTPGITVSGNNASRIFYISGITVNLSTLTLSDGNGAGSSGTSTTGTGGAIYIAESNAIIVTVTNSTISGNTATGNAGAIRAGSAKLTIANSTISVNTASGTAGAVRSNGTLTVTNSTFSGNTAGTTGGGIYINGGTFNLSNSIVAGNSAPTSPDISGIVTSGDYNLVQDTTGATLSGTHNITGQAPSLGALANNGGPTRTMALLSGSLAINAGDPNFDTTATPYDQRGLGYPRKVGSAIDIGAFEVQPPPAAPADLTIAKSHTGNFNQGDTAKTYSITVANSGGTTTSGTVTVTDTLPAGLTATGISGTGWTCNPLPSLTCTRTDALAAAGGYPAITVTVNVAANAPASVTNTATVSGGGESNTANNTATDPTTINVTATYSISGQVIYGTTPSASAARSVPGVTLNASGTPPATAASNLSGIYQLSGLGSGAYTVTPSKNGDVNHITANDALLIQQYGAYAANLTANQLIAADTNNDNQVNATDALYIQQYLAYVNTATPNIIEQWKFLPALRNYTLSGSLTNQNYTAVLVGEVDGDWVAPGGTNAPLQAVASAANESENEAPVDTNANDTNVNQLSTEKPRQGEELIKNSLSAAETATAAAAVSSVTVSLPTSATASTGTSITIPLTVSALPALTDANAVKTYAFSVQYDKTVLQYTGSDSTGTLSNGGTVVCGQPPADATNNRIVSCNYTNVNGITGQGTLLKLNFTVIGTSGQQSALTFVGTSRQPDPFIFNTGDPQAVTGNGSFRVLGATAATVSISGRVLTMSGRGITNVRLNLTDSSGQIRTATTTAFGYYRFDAVQAGETYILSAVGKHYTFSQPLQVLNINEETNGVDFIADTEKRTRVF